MTHAEERLSKFKFGKRKVSKKNLLPRKVCRINNKNDLLYKLYTVSSYEVWLTFYCVFKKNYYYSMSSVCFLWCVIHAHFVLIKNFISFCPMQKCITPSFTHSHANNFTDNLRISMIYSSNLLWVFSSILFNPLTVYPEISTSNTNLAKFPILRYSQASQKISE